MTVQTDAQRAAKRKWKRANMDMVRASARARYAANPRKSLDANRVWKGANPDKVRGAALRYRFGITLAERDAILTSQGGVCPICSAAMPGPKDWHTDHCHDTGAIRGILCHHCNTGIGQLKDNVETLKSAIKYLEHHSARIRQARPEQSPDAGPNKEDGPRLQSPAGESEAAH